MKRSIAVAALLNTVFLIAGTAHAQDYDSPAVSNTRARQIVGAALGLLGDEGAVEALRTLTLRGTGTRYWRGQGPNPDEPVRGFPLDVEWLIDLERGRVRRSSTIYQGQIEYFSIRSVYSRETSFNLEAVTNVFMPIASEAGERTRQAVIARYPQPRGRLLEAQAGAETLQYVGLQHRGGERYEVVTYAAPEGPRTLYFAPETGLLSGLVLGQPTSMPLGDAAREEWYDDYQSVRGITMPLRVRTTNPRGDTIGSVLTEDIQYSVEVDEVMDDDSFAPPDGSFQRRPDDSITISEVKDGVFFVENVRPNYNQLVVEFDDYLLVVDAPFNEQISEAATARIRESISEKPIRYLVATHFHFDHIGGLPRYVADGARVVTTSGNDAFVRDLVDRTSDKAGRPDDQAVPLAIDIVDEKRVITDGRQTVELYDLGPTPHVDEMLVAYLPDHKILYVADVFSADWGRVRPAIPETFVSAAKLRELALDVETILPSHGPRATMRDLERSLAQGIESVTRSLPPLLPESKEITLALSAAPSYISNDATVLVLRRGGYVQVREGSNGFTCLVDRQMVQAIEPMCLNPEASQTIGQLFLRRAELRETGMSDEDIDREIDTALETGALQLPGGLAISYMFSSGQDIYTDDGRHLGAYRPHVMLWTPYLTREQIGGPRQGIRRSDPYVFRSGQLDAALNVLVPEFVEPAR